MLFLIPLVFFCCLGSLPQNVQGDSVLSEELEERQVVPDVIDQAPDNVVEVIFDGRRVDPGEVLTPTQTKDMPKVFYPNDPTAFHVLCMFDPDVPSGGDSTGEFKHWLVGNIPGDRIQDGETRAEYIGPAPPEGSGVHRYIFVVFKQPDGKIDFPGTPIGDRSVENRTDFSIRNFAKTHNLEGPVAVNFFLAMYDDYVPEIQKQLNSGSSSEIAFGDRNSDDVEFRE